MEINPTFVQAKVQLAFCIYKTAMMQQSALLLQGAKRMFNDIITSHPKHADAYSLFAQVRYLYNGSQVRWHCVFKTSFL